MIEFIPAIDIIDGKCVRLSQGKYDSQKVYNENPVEVAKGIRSLRNKPLACSRSGWSSFTSCSKLSSS